MEPKIKSLLNDLINYRETRNISEMLKPVFAKLEEQEVYSSIGFLLMWQKGATLGINDPNKYELTDILYERYFALFEACPVLKQLFSLSKDQINWNEGLSTEYKKEIRDFIHENYKVQVRIRKDND